MKAMKKNRLGEPSPPARASRAREAVSHVFGRGGKSVPALVVLVLLGAALASSGAPQTDGTNKADERIPLGSISNVDPTGLGSGQGTIYYAPESLQFFMDWTLTVDDAALLASMSKEYKHDIGFGVHGIVWDDKGILGCYTNLDSLNELGSFSSAGSAVMTPCTWIECHEEEVGSWQVFQAEFFVEAETVCHEHSEGSPVPRQPTQGLRWAFAGMAAITSSDIPENEAKRDAVNAGVSVATGAATAWIVSTTVLAGATGGVALVVGAAAAVIGLLSGTGAAELVSLALDDDVYLDLANLVNDEMPLGGIPVVHAGEFDIDPGTDTWDLLEFLLYNPVAPWLHFDHAYDEFPTTYGSWAKYAPLGMELVEVDAVSRQSWWHELSAVDAVTEGNVYIGNRTNQHVPFWEGKDLSETDSEYGNFTPVQTSFWDYESSTEASVMDQVDLYTGGLLDTLGDVEAAGAGVFEMLATDMERGAEFAFDARAECAQTSGLAYCNMDLVQKPESNASHWAQAASFSDAITGEIMSLETEGEFLWNITGTGVGGVASELGERAYRVTFHIVPKDLVCLYACTADGDSAPGTTNIAFSAPNRTEAEKLMAEIDADRAFLDLPRPWYVTYEWTAVGVSADAEGSVLVQGLGDQGYHTWHCDGSSTGGEPGSPYCSPTSPGSTAAANPPTGSTTTGGGTGTWTFTASGRPMEDYLPPWDVPVIGILYDAEDAI